MNLHKKTNIIIFLVVILIVLFASVCSILYNKSLTFNLRKSDNLENDYVLSIYGRSGTEAICSTYKNGKMVASNSNSLSYFVKNEFYFKTKYQPKVYFGKVMLDQKIILFSETKNGIEEYTEFVVKKVKEGQLSPENAKNQKLLETKVKEMEEMEKKRIQGEKDHAN